MLTSLLKMTRKQFQEVNQNYLSILYQALFSTTYYGLFCVGELTVSNGGHQVLAKDVNIGTNKDKLMFLLRSSKTHNPGDVPQLIKITVLNKINADEQCPFYLLRKYLEIRPERVSENEPFFIFRSGEPVTATHFRSVLKDMLKHAGFKQAAYSTSSFRTGRAGDLLKAGLSIETIKKLGRWKSNAIFKYLRTI